MTTIPAEDMRYNTEEEKYEFIENMRYNPDYHYEEIALTIWKKLVLLLLILLLFFLIRLSYYIISGFFFDPNSGLYLGAL